jgi:pSer/pThr/pTyr-binding forkhead associated (FHA) protein
MTNITFNNDYGYSPGSPRWFVRRADQGDIFQLATREIAEAEAAKMAAAHPGTEFDVLAVTATIRTSPDVVGQRFDPKRAPAPEPTPEFAEVEPPAAPQPAAEEEQPL